MNKYTMSWIKDKAVFERTLFDARDNVSVDEERQPAPLQRLLFDSSELCTRAFFGLLSSLAQWGTDAAIYYVVLRPDPVSYFFAHFGKYPLIEIKPSGSAEEYMAVLNEDPGGSPADALGINWSEYMILPSSKAWFIRGLRYDVNDEGGHLWVPREWTTKVIEFYPYLRPEAV
jgi:hypothetical protein